jgi:ABC-type transport system involved in multi-copper enzyme maturation permease subunit
MREETSKAAGKLSTLIQWELEKTFTFLMLAIITAAVSAQSIPSFCGGAMSPSMMPPLAGIKGSFAAGLTTGLSIKVVSSFIYVVVIFAALASTGLSRDMSLGYTRVLLSYPIKRKKLFLSKILVLFFVPFGFFACSFLLGAALTYPSLFWYMS